MHWFRGRETQKDRNRAEVQTAFAEQKKSLYWTALMITGNAELAKGSIVDATGLAQTNSYAFRVWLVHWAHLATARVAVSAVRSSIYETAEQHADWICSHRRHGPLSSAEIRSLHELDAYAVIHQLDILARTVLVLYGCQHALLSDCVLLLNLPLRCVVGAYCRALQWYSEFVKTADKIRHRDFPLLQFVRHDPDAVPVWAGECSSVASGPAKAS